MKFSILLHTRYILLFCNCMLLICGLILVIAGFLILCDWPRVLLSRLVLPIAGSQTLPQPPLYYAALILLGVGLIICSAAVLGCWSYCVFNYWILTITFFIVIVLLLGECTMYGMVWLWPNCLGLSVAPLQLIRTLQRSYSKAGNEQYTAAVDLAQTMFNCCGISTSAEYDTSLWRLQALGHPILAVPLTCCVLSNIDDPNAYLDPSPVNTTKCQALEFEYHEGSRHIKGCLEYLEDWYQEQYVIFMSVGLVIVLVELAVILSILVACTKVNLHKDNSNSTSIDTVSQKITENIYENERPGNHFNNQDDYTLSRSFRQNYRINNKP